MGQRSMITLETAIFNGTVGGTAVAATGTYFNVDPFIILVGVAIAGSLASVGLRWMGGFLKDWKQRLMSFVCGVLLSVVAIPYLDSKGLMGLEAAIFVLFISLTGARIIKYMSTEFDITVIIDSFISRFKK